MTPRDIIKRGKVAVRQSATLYPIYQSLFKEAFGREPVCPTCGSPEGHTDWQNFENYAGGTDPQQIIFNTHTMQNKNFEVKIKSKIYRFNKQIKGTDRVQTVKIYGDAMTQEFAEEYLDNAKDDKTLLANRMADFRLLPEKYRKNKSDDAPVADAPVADAPVADAPVADAPVADAPVADAPVADAPVADAPVADAPVADAPVADAPVADAPVVYPASLKGSKEFAEKQGYPASEWEGIKTIKGIHEYLETKSLISDEDDPLK